MIRFASASILIPDACSCSPASFASSFAISASSWEVSAFIVIDATTSASSFSCSCNFRMVASAGFPFAPILISASCRFRSVIRAFSAAICPRAAVVSAVMGIFPSIPARAFFTPANAWVRNIDVSASTATKTSPIRRPATGYT